ncbi:MAG: DUF3592 domain-containing protein [Chloroflexota bacterium]|jgi:hypothetical protein
MTKKQYSIQWEDDHPVSFEVDGVTYERLEDVPDENDRRKLEAMMDNSFDLELEPMSRAGGQNKGVDVEKVILSVFSGVAALMLLIAGIASFNNILKISREASAPGRVVEVIERREYVNEQDRIIETYYYPVVEFTASDGKRRSVQMSEGSSSRQYEAGDEVTVLYNPNRPLDARIKSFGSSALMWVLPGITGILGVAFLGAVVAVRKLMPAEE